MNQLMGHSGNKHAGPHAVICAAEMSAEVHKHLDGMDSD